MKKQFIALSVMAVAAVCGASAHSVALHTDFDNDYTEEFPVSLDPNYIHRRERRSPPVVAGERFRCSPGQGYVLPFRL